MQLLKPAVAMSEKSALTAVELIVVLGANGALLIVNVPVPLKGMAASHQRSISWKNYATRLLFGASILRTNAAGGYQSLLYLSFGIASRMLNYYFAASSLFPSLP